VARLRVELTLEGTRLLSRVAEPYTARGGSELTFDANVGLPAMLKALDATDYDPEDFSESERDWLRAQEYICDRQGAWFFSARLRRKIGEALFAQLFPDESERSIVDQLRRERNDRDSGIDLEVQFDHDTPIAGELPWELLFHGDDFLVGANKGTLTRLVMFGEPPPLVEPITDLRLALIAPRPEGLANLGTLETDALTRVLQASGTHCAEIVWQGTRLSDFEKYLSDHRGAAGPHVIHFDGHGGFGRVCATEDCAHANAYSKRACAKCGRPLDIDAQGYLAFEGPANQPQYVTARRFADCVAKTSSVRLVIVNACRSGAAIGGGTVFNGVAQRLLERHVPAVIAMQFPVEVVAASRFTEVLYRELLRNERLPVAVSTAKTELDRERGQWFRPVLYVRARDNAEQRLFGAPPSNSARPGADLHMAVNALNLIGQAHPAPPGVQRTLADSKDVLQEVFAQLGELHDYKTIHDQIDALQYAFTVLEDAVQKVRPDAAEAWANIGQGAAGLHGALSRLKEATRGNNIRPTDLPPLQRVVQKCEDVEAAVDAFSRDKLREALNNLRIDLNLMPQRINQRLEDAAGDVHLPILAEAMQELESELRRSHADPAMLARFTQSKTALDEANSSLTTLIREHSAWQNVYDLLNTLPDKVDLEILKPTWERAKMEAGAYFIAQPRLGELSAAGARVETNVDSGDLPALTDAMADFRSLARVHFSRLDRHLLDRCEDLGELRLALDTLLKSMDTQVPAGEVAA
jgi:hypothetical protein